MFNLFKRKNENVPTNKTDSKNESNNTQKNEGQNDIDVVFKKETKKFEKEWLQKVKESDYVVIPPGQYGGFPESNRIIMELISERRIVSWGINGDFINEIFLLDEMLEIEESLINKFILLSNNLFYSYKSSPSFLNSNESSKSFSPYDEIRYERVLFEQVKFCLSQGYDFISKDKKIVSVQKNLYYLDWSKGIYFGFTDSVNDKWERGKGWYIYDIGYYSNQLFLFPNKLDDLEIINYGRFSHYQLLEHDEMNLTLFPKTWMESEIFNSCFNLLISFDFRKNLIKRTGEFYKTWIHQKKEEKDKIQSKLSEFLKKIDSDGNQIVDVTEENGFKILLDSYQEDIKEKDQKTIQNLVKLKLFIEDKGENLNKLFRLFEKIENENEMEHYVGVLNNEVNLYQKFCFHSMSLITFLVEGDMFSFFEVYEIFDNLNVFNSKWERDLSEKLDSIREEIEVTNSILESGFEELSKKIYSNTLQTQKSLEKLTYTNKESINNLTQKMDLRLQSVKSSIDTNNLLTLINTYQVYKINKNTKSLNP